MEIYPTITSSKRHYLKISLIFALVAAITLLFFGLAIAKDGMGSIGIFWATVFIFLSHRCVMSLRDFSGAEKWNNRISDNNYIKVTDATIELRRWKYRKTIPIKSLKTISYKCPYVRFIFTGGRLDCKESMSIFDKNDVDKFVSTMQTVVDSSNESPSVAQA